MTDGDRPVPEDPPAPSGDGARRPRRRRRRLLVGGVVVLLVVWGALVAAGALAAYRHDQRGLADLEQAKSHLNASDVTSMSAQQPLQAAQAEFDAGHAALSSPLFAPLDVLPVIGRQLAAIRNLSAAASTVAATGSSFLTQGHALLDAPHGSGPERVAALQQLSRISAAAVTRLQSIDTGPSQALLAPIAAKRNQFVSQFNEALDRLGRASLVSQTAATILQGPKTYLVLASNNAEMRAGSGAFLDIGTATMSDGSVHLGPMTPSGDLALAPGAVTVTGDLQRNWGWLQPGRDWRNLGVTPQFDVTASLAAQMWQAKTGQHVDGVIAVDVEGLRQLLRATGPVQADGVTISADTAIPYLLHDQYAGLTDSATQATGRHDMLGALASAVLHQLESQSTDLKALATAMADATQGRHLMLWSADPAAERSWQVSGVAGQLAYHSLGAMVLNRGGNKLDQYLSVGVNLHLAPSGSQTDATMTLHLSNATPPGQSQYIAGPYPGLPTSYGEYVGLVAVNLPGDATDLSISGAGPVVTKGVEGPTWLMVVPVDIAAGASADVQVRFRMPGRHGSMVVVPAARIPAEQWQVPGHSFANTQSTSVTW